MGYRTRLLAKGSISHPYNAWSTACLWLTWWGVILVI